MTVITVRDVALYLRSIGVVLDEFETRDASYACVSKVHMLGAHYDSVAKLLWEMGTSYDDTFDCEDFTMTFVWWAILAHRKAQRDASKYLANSPAVFECWIAGIGHAVVLCIEYTPAGLKHFFVEPQPRAANRELVVPVAQLKTISLVK